MPSPPSLQSNQTDWATLLQEFRALPNRLESVFEAQREKHREEVQALQDKIAFLTSPSCGDWISDYGSSSQCASSSSEKEYLVGSEIEMYNALTLASSPEQTLPETPTRTEDEFEPQESSTTMHSENNGTKDLVPDPRTQPNSKSPSLCAVSDSKDQTSEQPSCDRTRAASRALAMSGSPCVSGASMSCESIVCHQRAFDEKKFGSNTLRESILQAFQVISDFRDSFSLQRRRDAAGDGFTEKLVPYKVMIYFAFVCDVVWLCISTHDLATTGRRPKFEIGFETFLICVFVGDVLLRWLNQGCCGLFVGNGRVWNMHCASVALIAFFYHFSKLLSRSKDVSAPSTMGDIVVAIRIFRIVWVFTIIPDFSLFWKTLLTRRAWRIFFTTVVLLAVLLITVSVLAVGGTGGLCPSSRMMSKNCERFGSFDLALQTFSEVVYGFAHWHSLRHDSAHIGSSEPGSTYVLLVACLTVAAMPVLMAMVFRIIFESFETQQSLAEIEERRRDVADIGMIKNAFGQLDIDGSGTICIDEFQVAMEDPEVSKALGLLQLSQSDLPALLQLFDEDGTGDIDVHEFVEACKRLRGEGKSLDLMFLRMQSERILTGLHLIEKMLRELTKTTKEPRQKKETNTPPEVPPERKDDQPRRSSVFFMRGMQMPLVADQIRSSFKAGPGGVIKRPEHRAMSLRDLQDLPRIIQSCCYSEKWLDMMTGSRISPEKVNLHHFAYYFLCPVTASPATILKLSKRLPRDLNVGSVIVQRNVGEPRTLPIATGVLVCVESSSNSLTVEVTRGAFVPETSMQGHEVLDESGRSLGPVADINANGSLSFKEYYSGKAMAPLWYCSHWWGGTVVDFVRGCEEHALRRDLPPEEASYWVCGYANRQHTLWQELGSNPDSTPFRKAMRLAQGVLLHLEETGAPFERTWCCFELYKTVNDKNKLLDIVAMKTSEDSFPSPVLLSDGLLPGEAQIKKTFRESRFPLRILVKGMRAKLEDGSCTVQKDKDRILKTFGGTPGGASDIQCAVDRANRTLHAQLAVAAWPQAMQRGFVMDVDEQNPNTLRLPNIVSSDDSMDALKMSLSNFAQLTDTDVEHIALGIPANLKELSLSFAGCQKVSCAAVEHISSHLPSGLRFLDLKFTGCQRMTDQAIVALAKALPSSLVRLHLHFVNCPQISSVGVTTLASSLPKGLTGLVATFRGTRVDWNFRSPRELRASFANGGLVNKSDKSLFAKP